MPEARVQPADLTAVLAPSQPEVVLAPPRKLGLDLTCGQSWREEFEGVDMFADAKHRANLMKLPWPWADSSVNELHYLHFVEHIPMIYVSLEGEYRDVPTSHRRPCHVARVPQRVLAHPHAWRFHDRHRPGLRSNRAHQDPRHRRFLPSATVLRLNREWRAANKSDHCTATCEFVAAVGAGGPQADGTVPEENGYAHLKSKRRDSARMERIA